MNKAVLYVYFFFSFLNAKSMNSNYWVELYGASKKEGANSIVRTGDGVEYFLSEAFSWKRRLKLKPSFIILKLFKIGVRVEAKFYLSLSFSARHMNL